jgi:hypothetical protein
MSFSTTGNTFYNAQTFTTTFANVVISGANTAYLKVDDAVFQGVVAGYTSGGFQHAPAPTPAQVTNIIDKFPFATNSNASDVGDLTVARRFATGQSSSTSGYSSGGNPTFPADPPTGPSNVIDKFPFATNSNASDVGDLTVARWFAAGQSSSTSGYSSGGTPPISNVIDKFPFATNSNASDVGDLTVGRYGAAGQSSLTSGYSSSGASTPSSVNVIDKFPFATNSNASDVGDLTIVRYAAAGQSSTTSGYTSGGWASPYTNIIDRFPFATDGNATDVGDSTVLRYNVAGQSSTISGYTSGGYVPLAAGPGTPTTNVIEKFPFASNANATDVGDLTVARHGVTGQQN